MASHPRMEVLPFEPPAEPVQPLGPTPEQIRKAQKPQTVRVLRMLQTCTYGVTTGDFLRAGIGRFGARILELRAVGHPIHTLKLTEHAAFYWLEDA